VRMKGRLNRFSIEGIAEIVAIFSTASYRGAFLAMINSAGACEKLFRLKIQELEWQRFAEGVGGKLRRVVVL